MPYSRFNQSSGFRVNVTTQGWSNYDAKNGGCVTCPYSCVKSTVGPDGAALNFSNSTQIGSIPSIYAQPIANGCCYAPKSKSSVMPSCNSEASPKMAEDCGFLYGPTLQWRISNALDPPQKPLRAVLFASKDCLQFWAVQETLVKHTEETRAIFDSKMMSGGCYGDPQGVSLVLAGCLTEDLKFDKSKGYTWDMLASKCRGLGGKCVITNGLWGKHLKCCTSRTTLESDWDLSYEKYHKDPNAGVHLSGGIITLIVILGVVFLLVLVHFGKKFRERARQTAILREQEANDEYEEIMTPLTGETKTHRQQVQRRAGIGGSMKKQRVPLGPESLEVSLHEGDEIFRKKEPEVLYEGELS